MARQVEHALAAHGDAPVSILVEIRKREQRLEVELAECSPPTAMKEAGIDAHRLKRALT